MPRAIHGHGPGVAMAICLAFCLGAVSGTATAQKEDRNNQPDENTSLRIGVVDVARLISDSPQADRAKTSMAKQFARRKNELEETSESLRQEVERLNRDGAVMSDSARDELESRVRDRQRELQMAQSKYNDDVAAAEQTEFERMREDIRDVIDRYAEDNGYDLVLGDAVLYATESVDVTDEILAQLKKR